MPQGQGPPQPSTPIGPLVPVRNGPISVAVVREYGPRPSNIVMWSGRVGLFLGQTPIVEIEVSLMASKDGREPWVSLPQRSYTKDGQQTYQRTVYFADEAFLSAIADAIAQMRAHGGPPF